MGAESVRAILEGRKTQTRRVIDPHKYNIGGWDMPRTKEDMEAGYPFAENADGDFVSVVDWCPYGRVGDRLWVREAFKIAENVTENGNPVPIYKAGCSQITSIRIKNWKSPLFMPRRLSRITLEITDIRVERVQDITEEDARAEGTTSPLRYVGALRHKYKHLWDSLNAKRGYPWEKNPWVWVVSFKVVKGC